jgi:membrane protease subunit HflC
VVLAILFVVLCTFVRRPYERVLVIRFGQVIEEPQQARLAYNWYFKMPTDSVIRMDKRLHLYTSPLKQVGTAGSEPIAIRTFAAWRIKDPNRFYRTLQGSDARAKEIIGQKVVGLVSGKMSNHRLDEIFNVDTEKVRTGKIEAEIAEEATSGSPDLNHPGEKEPGLDEQGIEIVQVGFSRIAFPPSNADAIYRRMAEERNVQAQAFIADGQKEASMILSTGRKEATRIRAEAVGEAERLRGEGDAKAVAIIAAVQTDPAARNLYQYLKSMEMYKNSLTKSTIMVLPADSEILKNLFAAPAGGGAATQPAKGHN